MINWRSVLVGLTLATLLVASVPAASHGGTPASGAPAAQADAVHAPGRAAGSWSARLAAPVRATSKPGGGRTVARLSTATTWSHQPQALLVLDSHDSANGRRWLKVLLPVRPTGRAGWIPRNRVVLRKNRLWIEIRKKGRQLVIFRNGRRIRHYRVVIGARGTPTPAGLAAIYERNRQPDPKEFLGPWSLPLTALSRTLKNFGGGPGRIAIHGRGGASYNDPLGSAASHGCIRIPNRAVRWLARKARPGTPVVIRN